MNYPKYNKLTINGWVWGWCSLCETNYVECPRCGNNCCNGERLTWEERRGRDDLIKCAKCKEAHDWQDAHMGPPLSEFKVESYREDPIDEIFGS